MRQTLENLRERPKDEKNAIAVSIALGVVAILFIGWVIYFLHSLASAPASNLSSAANATSTTELQQAAQQVQQAYGSSTQFINTSEGVQLEQVSGTSSEPSL